MMHKDEQPAFVAEAKSEANFAGAPGSAIRRLMAGLDDRNTHDTASLKALGGIFYKIGNEEWCDTAIKSWRKEDHDLWVCRG